RDLVRESQLPRGVDGIARRKMAQGQPVKTSTRIPPEWDILRAERTFVDNAYDSSGTVDSACDAELSWSKLSERVDVAHAVGGVPNEGVSRRHTRASRRASVGDADDLTGVVQTKGLATRPSKCSQVSDPICRCVRAHRSQRSISP